MFLFSCCLQDVGDHGQGVQVDAVGIEEGLADGVGGADDGWFRRRLRIGDMTQ